TGRFLVRNRLFLRFTGKEGWMRLPRLKPPCPDAPAYYHCMSRVVDRRFILEAPEKEHFRDLMRECEEFCEVRILTFCILGNHFHLVVEIPPRPARLPTAEEMLEKLSRLSGHQKLDSLRQRFEAYRKCGDADGEARELARLHARLWDLSAFMKLLKQRFSQWYNRRAGGRGTLWEGRFRSVLVEGVGEALISTAGYVDLNPVRAGLVRDPKDYRWSGYGEAVAGSERAQAGLQLVARCLMRGEEQSVVRSLELYRMRIFQQGSEENEAVG